MAESIESFPCREPAHPDMESMTERLLSFYTRDRIWPSHGLAPPCFDLATAGFFYTGVEDRVKCWYCNGGLETWSIDDDAWEEHAKYFPLCEFLLNRMGSEFAHRVVFNTLRVRRPNSYNTTNSPSARRVEHLLQLGQLIRRVIRETEETFDFPPRYHSDPPTGEPGGASPRPAGEVLMGGLPHSNVEAPPGPAEINPPLPDDVRNLESVTAEDECKVCLAARADALIMLCGHLCCCTTCASALHTCPVCRGAIGRIIKVFRV